MCERRAERKGALPPPPLLLLARLLARSLACFRTHPPSPIDPPGGTRGSITCDTHSGQPSVAFEC